MSSVASWVIGVILCHVASLGEGIAILTVRKSWLVTHNNNNGSAHGSDGYNYHEDGSSSSSSYNYCRNKKKWTYLRYGAIFWMIAINPTAKIIALALTSPSLVAPFSGVVLAWVILLQGRIVGSESTEWIRIGAALMIMLGSLLVSLFGDHNSHNDDEGGGSSDVVLNNMVDSYQDPIFRAYLIIAAIIQVMLLMTICFANTNPSDSYWKRYAWGVAAGFLLGSFENFPKDAITIVQVTVINTATPTRLPSYFWLFSFLALVVGGGSLLLLILCAKRYDAVFTSGSSAASYSLMASLMSAIHYDTFSHLSSGLKGFILYPLGLTCLLVGVCALVHWSKDEEDGGEEVADEAIAGERSANNTKEIL